MVIPGSILSMLSVDDTKKIVKFIKNYAEVHAVILPGRYPGLSNSSDVVQRHH